MTTLVDIVITRKPDDPTRYRGVISNYPEFNLIEVDYVPGSVIQARMNLINHGSSPYISWFDPDDTLHPWGLHYIRKALQMNPDIDGVLTESATGIPGKPYKRIDLNRFHEYPVNCHLMRAIRREWLEKHIEYFNNPVPEWALLAKLLLADSIILPVIGYTWVPNTGTTHTAIDAQGIKSTKEKVIEILGDKYDYNSKIRRPIW